MFKKILVAQGGSWEDRKKSVARELSLRGKHDFSLLIKTLGILLQISEVHLTPRLRLFKTLYPLPIAIKRVKHGGRIKHKKSCLIKGQRLENYL